VNTSNQMQLGSSSLMTVMSSGNMVVSNPTLSAINSTTTATTAQVVGGYITSTSAAVTTITLPTAAAIATQLGGAVSRGTSFEFSVDNTSGANTITLAVNTGITVPTSAVTGGSTLTVSTANKLGRFRLTFTSPTTAVLFRLF
jgi:ABC-type tungstate transport system substrate-binding protein